MPLSSSKTGTHVGDNDNDMIISRLQFRPPTPEDITRCYEIESTSYPPDEAASLKRLAYRQREANRYFQLCCLENNGDVDSTKDIIGFICSTRCAEFEEESMSTHRPDGQLLAIHSVVVDEPYRRRGIATFMLRRYVQAIKDAEAKATDQHNVEEDKQYAPIQSIVLLAKQNLLGFYAQCGFRVNRPSPIAHGKDTWFELQQDIP